MIKQSSKFPPVIKTVCGGCEILRAIVYQGRIIFSNIEQREVWWVILQIVLIRLWLCVNFLQMLYNILSCLNIKVEILVFDQSTNVTLIPLLLPSVPTEVIFMKFNIFSNTDTTDLKSRVGKYSRI